MSAMLYWLQAMNLLPASCLFIGTDGQKFRLELFARPDVDRDRLPVVPEPKAALFQHDVNLLTIVRGP